MRARQELFQNDKNNSLIYRTQNLNQEFMEHDGIHSYISCQKQNKSVQTEPNELYNQINSVNKYLDFDNLADLFSILIDLCGQFNSIKLRVLSVTIYVLLRILNVPFSKCRLILDKLNLLTIQQCHEWALTIIDEDDLCVILRDRRVNHKQISFYDCCPELEAEAKSFALANASKKTGNFTVEQLAKFINQRFREIYANILEQICFDPNKYVRSVESCRTDLLKWGAKFEKNKKRPYFEGHERPDVVLSRKKFIDYMIDCKDFYFVPFYDGNQQLVWQKPTRRKRILISHDESTFRSGEIPAHRWLFEHIAPFFKKGRGRSIMTSMFIVQADDCQVFELNEDEWKAAIRKYPNLDKQDNFLNYYSRSANAWIEPRKDNYFDNQEILKQFERLFILLKFKKSFQNCKIDVLDDNARTHSAKIYDVNLFNKFPGTNCPYNSIEWEEGGIKKR